MRLWVLKNSMEREQGIKERTAYVHINNLYVECLWFLCFCSLLTLKFPVIACHEHIQPNLSFTSYETLPCLSLR